MSRYWAASRIRLNAATRLYAKDDDGELGRLYAGRAGSSHNLSRPDHMRPVSNRNSGIIDHRRAWGVLTSSDFDRDSFMNQSPRLGTMRSPSPDDLQLERKGGNGAEEIRQLATTPKHAAISEEHGPETCESSQHQVKQRAPPSGTCSAPTFPGGPLLGFGVRIQRLRLFK